MGALCNRVAKLTADHKATDDQILGLQSRPQPDTLAIADLKRKKLRIKEQLRQLQNQLA